MYKIRRGTFETNSSSTHSLTMCMKEDFEKWKNGEKYWNRWNEELVDKKVFEEEISKIIDEFKSENSDFDENDEAWAKKLNDYIAENINDDKTFYTYKEFNDYDYIEYETFGQEMKTKNGDEVVAFGYFGSEY